MANKVTVIIPVYNEEKHLEECLDSLHRQSFSDAEFLVLDNASDDASQAIASKYCSIDKRFTYLRHRANIGAALSLAYGYAICDGEYVSIFGAHDYISNSLLASQVAILDEDKSISIVSGIPYTIHANGGISERKTAIYDFTDSDPLLRYLKSIAQLCDCTIFQSLFRKSCIGHLDLMKSTVKHGDHIVISQILWHGKLAYSIGERYYRRDYNSNGDGQAQRTERVTGSSHAILTNGEFISCYLSSFRSLFKGNQDAERDISAWIERTLKNRFPS